MKHFGEFDYIVVGGGAAGRGGFGPDRAAMSLDDRAANCEADAQAVALRRIERGEDRIQIGGGKAEARVGDVDLNEIT